MDTLKYIRTYVRNLLYIQYYIAHPLSTDHPVPYGTGKMYNCTVGVFIRKYEQKTRAVSYRTMLGKYTL